MKDTTPEHATQIAIQEYLTLKGHFVWRNNSGMLQNRRGIPVRFGKVGSSDIIGIHKDNGRFIAIEVKRPSGSYKPTQPQLDFIEAIKRHGGYAGVATCIKDVDAILCYTSSPQ